MTYVIVAYGIVGLALVGYALHLRRERRSLRDALSETHRADRP